jgi:predicted porin
MSSKKEFGFSGMKCLIAAIVVGTVVGAPAWAQELSIYGVGHLSADSIDTGSSTSSYIHSNSSRLGFKGKHNLGNAYSILFQYESGVDLSGHGTGDGNGGANSQGQFFTRTRDSFVGIRGDAGTVLFGRVGGLNQWLYDYNLFADQVGDLGNIFGGDGLPGRLDNTIAYRSPNFDGLSAGVTYAPNQGTSKANDTVIKADYTIAALKLGAAYASFGNGNIASKDSATKVTSVMGSYDVGAFNLGGGWMREANIGGLSNLDRNMYTLGAAAKLGSSGTVKAQYVKAADLNGTANTGAGQWAVGYDHAWDKNATLYIAYARINNDNRATFAAHDYGHGDQGVPGILAGRAPSVVSMGVVYKFDVAVLKR